MVLFVEGGGGCGTSEAGFAASSRLWLPLLLRCVRMCTHPPVLHACAFMGLLHDSDCERD